MKINFLSLFLAGAALVTSPLAHADGTAPSATPVSTPDTSAPVKHQHHGRFKAALAQLNLTDAQKAQIQQIHSTVPDHKQRRQQIMAVLTTDQQAQLKALLHHGKHAATAPAPTAN